MSAFVLRARRTRVVLSHGAMKCDADEAWRIAAEHDGVVQVSWIELHPDGQVILGPWVAGAGHEPS